MNGLKLAFLTCGKTNEIISCIGILSASFEKSNIPVIVKDAVDLMPNDASDAFMFFYAQKAVHAIRPFMFLNASDSFHTEKGLVSSTNINKNSGNPTKEFPLFNSVS